MLTKAFFLHNSILASVSPWISAFCCCSFVGGPGKIMCVFFSGEDMNLSNFSLNLVGSSESGGKFGLYKL